MLIKMNKLVKYPVHLYDSLRRKIAVSYIQHELRKLFPSLKSEQAWNVIDADVEKWFSGNILSTPVRIFWNGFHAIARGFRFKNLLPYVTSNNIQWQESLIKLSELDFGFVFRDYDFLGQYVPVAKVKASLDLPEHAEAKAKILSECQQDMAATFFRDNDPIIVRKIGDRLRVADGNRRLFLAMCEGKEEMPAFIAEPAGEPEIFEQWVPAQFLQDLLSLHSLTNDPAQEKTAATARIISEALRNSTSGRIEWDIMCETSANPLDKLMRDEVAKLL